MGKNAQQKNKKRKRQELSSADIASTHLPTPDSEDPTSDQLISPAELQSTLLVLRTLVENPDELLDPYLKPLKRDIHDIHRILTEGTTLGTSLTAKVSAALQESRFTDALILLFEMYTRRLPPKLGAIQRWVRECDATSDVDEEGDPEAMRCLDMILRVASMGTEAEKEADTRVVRGTKAVWRAREKTRGEIQVWGMMSAGKLFGEYPHASLLIPDTPPVSPYPNFRPVHHVPGPLRRPPNLYDSTVYASAPSAISLSPSPPTPARLDVPGVPGAFIILDVFTPAECLQIVQAASAIGFESDEAAEGSARAKTSILAKNFVWLADKPFLEHFYDRIKGFFPQTAPVADGAGGVVDGGGRLRGINARFRVYQYTQNQVYRPHIDGAWPAAGLHPETGEYMHDSSPPDNPLWSRYTLLVYLNQDIPTDTGCTTFFLPSPDRIGSMDSVKVAPIQGAVLCFPHGDTHGSLLHEGSAVGAGGGKIVIRTDLLYEAKGFGAFKPPASVGVKQGGKGEEGAGG